jgi:hypothetical protein
MTGVPLVAALDLVDVAARLAMVAVVLDVVETVASTAVQVVADTLVVRVALKVLLESSGQEILDSFHQHKLEICDVTVLYSN